MLANTITHDPEQILKGQKVLLRPITLDDVTATYVGWLRDPDVYRFLETRHKEQTLESVRQFVGDMIDAQDQHLYAMCHLEDGRHIGNIKVGPVKKNHALADVSLFIGDKTAWGHGIASEAIGLISQYAFNILNLKKLNATAYEANIGSIKSFQKVGYQIEGVRRRHYLLEGKLANLIELGLCFDDEVRIPV